MNLAVIFGGESCEHDISIITGMQLISKANSYLYDIYPIYIDKNGTWLTSNELKDIDSFSESLKKAMPCAFLPNDKSLYIRKGNKYKKYADIDVAFVCLHGMRGEDGMVASVLELSKIPYSSSSICPSSVCMDKCVFKTFSAGLNVPTVDGICTCENDFIRAKNELLSDVSKLGYPVIIKPSRQGSSIGIEVCSSSDELEQKLKNAFKYDKKVLIEKFLDVKKEVNIAVFEDKGSFVLSSTEEPISKDEILSFDNKYRKNSGGFETIKRIVPAGISKKTEDAIKNIALKLYNSLNMFGIVRFDFLIDKGDNVYINEVNTIPGSMANYLFDKEKYSYPSLIEILITNAIHRFEYENEVLKTFDTDVLDGGFDGFKK